MKKLYIQTYFNIGNDSKLMNETPVNELENYKEYPKKDIPLMNFINNKTFKLIYK